MVYYLLIIKLGSISLNDLELCREFFLNQNINLEIVQSHLNSFKLKIPWRSLKEKVYFCLKKTWNKHSAPIFMIFLIVWWQFSVKSLIRVIPVLVRILTPLDPQQHWNELPTQLVVTISKNLVKLFIICTYF